MFIYQTRPGSFHFQKCIFENFADLLLFIASNQSLDFFAKIIAELVCNQAPSICISHESATKSIANKKEISCKNKAHNKLFSSRFFQMNQFCSKFFSKFFNFSTKWMKCFRFFQKLIHSSLRWCPGGVPSPLCPLMNLLIANSKSSLNGFRCCKSLVESRWLTTTIFWG